MAAKTSDFPVKQKQLNEDISTGNLRNCYFIYGDETYLRFQNRDKLLKAFGVSENSMNFNRYEGEGCVPGQIIDMAETMPFLAEKRVILVQDSGFFSSGCPELADYLKNPSESTSFIFVEEEVDKRKDIYKAVSKIGFEMECTTQDEGTLKKWIVSRFSSEGKKISQRAQDRFIDRVGTDMSNIASEIEKLVCYCIDRDEITEKDIDAVCANYLTSHIYAMIDAITEQNGPKAMELYYDLLSLKEKASRILFLITRQFNLILQVKEMSADRISQKEIASALKLAPFVVEKYQKLSRNYTTEKLRKCLDMCASNDDAVKKGKLDATISVEMIIIGSTSI